MKINLTKLGVSFYVGLLLFLFNNTSFGQFSATLYNDGNSSAVISGLPTTVCNLGGGLIFQPGLNCTSTCILNKLNSTSFFDYHTMDSGINWGGIAFTFSTNDGNFGFSNFNVTYYTKIGTPDESSILVLGGTAFCFDPGACTQTFYGNFTPPLGGLQDAIVIELTGVGTFILPLSVTGPTSDEVPILETVRTPIIPQTIIYDPPGDGSTSSWNTSTEFCREYSTSVETAMGFSNNTDITLGIAGEAGFIVTTEFEAGVTLSGGFSMNTSRTTETTFEQCLEVSQTFTTSSLDANIGEESDLIIGVSQLQHLAIGDVVKLGACQPVSNKELYIWTEGNEATLSVMTEALIIADIAALQNVISAGVAASSDEIVAKAENQIDVWNQILALKANNELTAAQETGSSFTYSEGSMIDEQQQMTTTQSVSINYQTVVDINAGLEVFASVGGSGISNSSELNWVDTKGQGTSTANGMTEIIQYNMFDDDDNLNVDVFRDPTFGTPILRLNPTSATSCPYEGGYRKDQPGINIASLSNPNVAVCAFDDVPYGTAAIFNLEASNLSDYVRTYTLELENNINGAIVKVGSTTLNNQNNILDFTDMGAGTSITPLLTIERNPALPLPGQSGYQSSFDTYDDLMFKLYPACGDSPEEDEAVYFNLSVTFGAINPAYDSDCDGSLNVDDLCPDEFDTALNFAGGNNDPLNGDYIEIPNDINQNLVHGGDFTMEAWVYPTSSTHKTIISKGHGFTGPGTDYIFSIWDVTTAPGNGKLGFYSTGVWLFSSSVIGLNEWSHVAVTFDDASDQISFYINGQLDNQGIFDNSNIPNPDYNSMYISRQGYSQNVHNFVGDLDDIVLWNKKLSSSEILTTMHSPLDGSETGLVAYYNFNDAHACVGSPTKVLVDKGPHAMHGTLVNFEPLSDCTSDWTSGRNLDSDGDSIGDACDNKCTNDLSADLVSYWSFDNSVDDHQGNNNGTIVGSGSTFSTAAYGDGIDLDGGNTYVNVGNDPSLNMTNSDLTISAWFRVDAFTDFWQTLISKGEGSNYRIARYSDSDSLSFNGSFPDVTAPVDINDDQFHHVAAVTKNGEYKNIYIDGVLMRTDLTGAIITDANLDLLIGNNPDILSRDWNGVIDDVAIWNTALTDCDIDLIYNANMSLGDIMGIATSSCPPSQDLTGTQSTNEDYESGGYISSDQTINSPAQVDYDASTEITLLETFEVKAGAVFHAFIDGCGNLLRQANEYLD